MKKLLPHSDLEILVRIAQRRAINAKIQQEEINDKRLALDQYIANRLDLAKIDKTLLSDPLSREILFNTLNSEFQYTQTPENVTKLATMKALANDILPDTIKAEKWSTGDCGCTVQRIYHKDTPEDTQTFYAKNCSEHEGLNIEELHDTIDDETHRRANIHRFLHQNFVGTISEVGSNGELKNKAGVDIKFSWEGKGKERILVVDVSGADLLNEQKTELTTFSDNLFGTKNIKGRDVQLVKLKQVQVIESELGRVDG